MLPDFPALKRDIWEFAEAGLRRRVETGDPVLSRIKRLRQREGGEMEYEQLGFGRVREGFECHGAEFQVHLSEVPTLVGEKFRAKIEGVAEVLISQSAKSFFKKMGQVCEKAGNAFDAGGAPASAEMILEVLDKVQMEFGPDGKPTHSLVIHPDMHPALEKIDEQIRNDPELRRRHSEIIERQREAWLTRQSGRKLAD